MIKTALYLNSLWMLVLLSSWQFATSFTLFKSPSLSSSSLSLCNIHNSASSTSLSMISQGRSSSIASNNRDRSKRQERVGHIVRTEIASIIQQGYQIKNQKSDIDDELRRRINVVNADVSPDLRQARITVSVMKRNRNRLDQEYIEEDEEEEEEDEDDQEYDEEYDEEYDDEEYDDENEIEPKMIFPEGTSRNGDSIVDRRQSYAWLVRNTKQIRHAMSQRLSHMKTVPNLTFVLADVGAAVDVMNLIEKVSKGNYKREDIGTFGGDNDSLPSNMYLDSDLDNEYDYEWIDDEDDDFDEEEDDSTSNAEGKQKK